MVILQLQIKLRVLSLSFSVSLREYKKENVRFVSRQTRKAIYLKNEMLSVSIPPKGIISTPSLLLNTSL